MKEVIEEKLISPVHRLLLQCTWYFEKSKVSLSPFKIKMLGKSCARNKTLTKTCTCACVCVLYIFMYVYEHIIAVCPHVLLLHELFCCSSVHKGREGEDREGRCRRLALQLLQYFGSFDYIWIMQAIFFFLTVLLGERKWASLVNRSNCLCNRIDYLFKMAYAAGL